MCCTIDTLVVGDRLTNPTSRQLTAQYIPEQNIPSHALHDSQVGCHNPGMRCWSQLDFSAIPVSISAVSLTSRQTWQTVNSKRRLQRIPNVQEGKRHQKKETSSCFVFVSSFFGEKFPTGEFCNFE
jgi:hypothetical protein